MATSKISADNVSSNGTWSDTNFNNVALTRDMEIWLVNNSQATFSNAPTGFSGRGAIVGFKPADGVYLTMLYDSAYGKAWLRCKWWTSWNNWAELA